MPLASIDAVKKSSKTTRLVSFSPTITGIVCNVFICVSQEGHKVQMPSVTVRGQKTAPVVINVKKGETKNQCPQQ